MEMGGMLQRHMERLAQQLELTDDQQAQVRMLVRPHAKDAIRLRADMGVMAIDVRQLLDAEPMELPKAKQLLPGIAVKEADLRFTHLTLMQEIGRLLTPEQQKKFRTITSSTGATVRPCLLPQPWCLAPRTSPSWACKAVR